MWLEKSFGRETSACVVRVAVRRQRVRRSFMKGLRLLLYLGGGFVDGADEEKVSGPRMVWGWLLEAKCGGLSTARFTTKP
jgi:hypothetical protein